ncbi:MAG: CDC27 family protein [Candidatus Latescibacteria bacterium]|jgi:tetratricopeptide (TPR) repeat protein|nr:CDC27 family protein [Candidatus Latescibacterota bacterium]
MLTGSSNGHTAPLTTLLALYTHTDSAALEQAVLAAYSKEQLLSLALEDADFETRKAATYALSVVGDLSYAEPLAAALHTDLPGVHQTVEQALWCLWFKSGRADVDTLMQEGARLLESQCFDDANVLFDRVIALVPDFAEGYNQRAVVSYLQEDWTRAIQDCQAAVSLNPVHFGALAGMGHCYLQCQELQAALTSYEKALAVNPHMPAIQSNIDRIRKFMDEA